MDKKQLAMRLGGAIRARRERTGLSQESFADAIEMHRAYYGHIERGEKNVTLLTLHRIAEGLGLHPSDLLKDAGF